VGRPITINCDMGESFGLYKMGDDAGIMPYITLANVACGFHASDPLVMRRTVRLAKERGVRVGAHPSLPDLQGFGRREMRIEPEELRAAIIYQVGALKGFLDAEGMALSHIKPHGALYGMASRTESVAHAICDAAQVFGVALLGMAGTIQEAVYERRGIPFVREFYADLDYDDTANLIITREHAAVDAGAAAERTLRAIREGKVRAVTGKDVAVVVESVCVHSDTPGAVAVAREVHRAIAEYLH
jgi:5-oxoprolinase (ATP-hydrolysing) subunit A